MTLVYDPHLVPIEEVEKRAGLIGVDLREHFEHKTVRLLGLDCPDCAMKLEKGISRLNGVLWVSTNFASSRMSVEFEPSKVGPSTIWKRVRDLGYGISETDDVGRTLADRARERASATPGRWLVSRQTALTSAAGVLIILGLLLGKSSFPGKMAFGLAALAGGIYAARGAYFSLRSLVLDLNFLMTVAAVGAIALGDWLEAAAVMFLFSLGNTLEARTVDRARESVRSLIGLFPTQARVRRGTEEIEIPVNEVAIGEMFIVRPGEKIATDGIVVAGSSTVNQASITGESEPVEKVVGAGVFAGSINQRGSLDIRATATSQDNTLAKIIHLVEAAQAEKAPSQRFAEKFGRYYTPSVLILAALTGVLLPFVSTRSVSDSIYIALTLLVVSCPCALVISTPVTIVSAIGNAARNGILVKGGSHLEAAGAVEVVAFDKTGTLTAGEAKVTDVIPCAGYTKEQVLSLVAGVESRSEHPLAESIMCEARERGVQIAEISDFEGFTGMGATAKFNGDSCVVGNTRLMEQLGIDLGPHAEEINNLQTQGKTAVLVSTNGQLVGIVALADTIRDSAKEAFAELRKIGVHRIVMITGDNQMSAQVVARQLGVDEYYAELLPQDKVDIVRVLIERFGSRVAVIGDGVNDAPALAAATVGIAMGAAGSDTAIETADIALMSNDLRKLAYTIKLSRTAVKTIRQNTIFSLGVILALIYTALIRVLNLPEGVLGHEGSALIVVANGMRLLRFKDSPRQTCYSRSDKSDASDLSDKTEE